MYVMVVYCEFPTVRKALIEATTIEEAVKITAKMLSDFNITQDPDIISATKIDLAYTNLRPQNAYL